MAEKSQDNNPSRLYRSEENRVIAGVCGGLGEFFNIDPTIIRIIFVILTIFGGSGLLIYLILWIVIPSESQSGIVSKSTIKGNVAEIKTKINSLGNDYSRFWWALFIVVLGFIFLFNNFGLFDFFEFRKLWPVILILLGLSIVLKQ